MSGESSASKQKSPLGKTFSINTFEKVTNEGAMQNIVTVGQEHIQSLHSYKSSISGLVQVKGDAENKKDLYKKNLELLAPNIQKMRELAQYYELMLTTVTGYIDNLLHGSEVPTAEQVTCLIEVLDTVVILDALKTWQMGLNNDFSMYRRAIQHVKKDYNMSEDEALRFFLITANNISKGLKNALQQKVSGYEKVLVYVIKCCADRFEQNQDHQYLRVAVFCVSMIDSILADAEKVGEIKKQIKLNKTQKLFLDHPRITLYKELPMNVANILKNCPNFTEASENDKGNGCPLF
jgi:hypothetical protein